MKVLVNGRLIGRSEASIDLEDRGYQFGDGIYEVIRVYKGVLFGLREHAERFFRSAAEIGISLPFSIEDLEWDLQKLASDRYGCHTILWIFSNKPCGKRNRKRLNSFRPQPIFK